MNEEIFVKHEMRAVFNILNALQIRADNLIYSKEHRCSDGFLRNRSNEHLEKVFGVSSISNTAVDLVLKEVQKNYVALAKEILQEEPRG